MSELEHLLVLRGVDTPCKDCDGLGTKVYGSTSTWRGGIGGQAITGGPCNVCWGSGEAGRPWPSHREFGALRARIAELEAEVTRLARRDYDSMDAIGFLRSIGYWRCDIPACNCNSYHYKAKEGGDGV